MITRKPMMVQYNIENCPLWPCEIENCTAEAIDTPEWIIFGIQKNPKQCWEFENLNENNNWHSAVTVMMILTSSQLLCH